MARIDDQLAALESLEAAALRQEWERVYKGPAPRLPATLLRMGIGYRLQERVHGKLAAGVARALAGGAASPSLKPGTQLVRSWNGRTIAVLVTDDGYVFEERVYSSLSAIARDVTGAAWSGPRFFGVRHG